MQSFLRVLHSIVFWPMAFGSVLIAWAVALIRSCYMPVPKAFRLIGRLFARIVFWSGRVRVTAEGPEHAEAALEELTSRIASLLPKEQGGTAPVVEESLAQSPSGVPYSKRETNPAVQGTAATMGTAEPRI